MNKRQWLCGLLVALALPCQAQFSDKDLEIRFGTDATYAPFESTTPTGQIVGFDIDLTKAICAELKAKCIFMHQPWDGIVLGLEKHKYDAIVSSMSITPERQQHMDFTHVLWDVSHALLSKKSQPLQANNASLSKKTIAVQKGTIEDAYARKYWTSAKIKGYTTIEQGLDDLARGRVQAVFADKVVLGLYQPQIRGSKRFAISDEVLSTADPMILGEGAAIAVRKGDTRLLNALNRGLEAILRNGVYQRIQARYFDYNIYNH
ncbi:MAG: transporter substrate-binding domain-containing protein [Formosimonas sp.]